MCECVSVCVCGVCEYEFVSMCTCVCTYDVCVYKCVYMYVCVHFEKREWEWN